MPSFGKIKKEPVTYLATQSALLEHDYNLMVDDIVDTEAQPIEFKCTRFKYCFIQGSRDSLNFHQSLLDTDNYSIFQSEVIQRILHYKWQSVKKFAYIQGSIMAIFLIIMFVH